MAGKGKKRSNGVVAAIPSERLSIGVREIKNGFLIERSGVTKRGRYVSETEFSAGKPVVMAAAVPTKGAASAPPAKSNRPSTKPAGPREVGFLKA